MFKSLLSPTVVALTSATFSFTIATSSGAYALTGLHAKVKVGHKTCFSSHTHTGFARSNTSKRNSVQAAVKDWTSFTKLEYGAKWANFRIAHKRKMSCSRSGQAWNCKVVAIPCKG